MEPSGSIFFYSLAVVLLLTPLYKAGARPLPVLLLELAAVALLFALALDARHGIAASVRQVPAVVTAGLAVLLFYPLLQLFPLPSSIWATLPGHGEYASVLSRFGDGADSSAWRAASLIPSATEYAWLALLPPLACMLSAMRLSSEQVARLLLIMSVFVGLEALLGLLQVGTGGESIFYLRNTYGYGTATGTFVNRNHLAAMLAMMLPVMVGLLVFSMRPGRRRRNVARQSEAFSKRALLFGSAALVLVALFFTRSRAGIGTALVGLAFSAILLVRARAASEGSSRTRLATWLVMGLVVVSVFIAVVIGLAPILERFEPTELRLSAEGRFAVYTATLRGAMEFLPFGSGLGTYAEIFPRFQGTTGIGNFFAYAHNEYLQAFMEMGIPGLVGIALLLIGYAVRLVQLLFREGGRSFTLLQLGAAVGLLPLIIHSLFDFGLRMPANAIWFATLAGVMFHRGVAVTEPFEGERRKASHQQPQPSAHQAVPIP